MGYNKTHPHSRWQPAFFTSSSISQAEHSRRRTALATINEEPKRRWTFTSRLSHSFSTVNHNMRMTRHNSKLHLYLSIALNIIALGAILYLIEDAHNLAPESLVSKADEFGLSRWKFSDRQAVMDTTQERRGCGMCEMDVELCGELGEDTLSKVMGYTGTNLRLRRALAKMRRGDPFTVGVVGGSVSKGQGLSDPNGDNAHSVRNFHRMVFDHLNMLFPASGGVILKDTGRVDHKNSFVNGAQGGMGTDYFSFCFNEHIPEDVDLVLVEFGINDEVQLKNMDSYELLIRGLLDLPNKPAIINVQVFALVFQYLAGGGDLHNGIAQFYDIPSLSLRNVLLPEILKNSTAARDYFVLNKPEEPWTQPLQNVDTRHLSRRGHDLLGRLAIAYVDSQLCEMDRQEARSSQVDGRDLDSLYPVEDLPRARLMAKFDPDSVFPVLKPQCFSTNGQKHPLKPFKQNGWRDWNWKEKNYIISDTPGSTISFRFSTSIGTVRIHYLRSYQYHLGSASCWVDDDLSQKTRLDGFWKEPYNIGKAATIRDDLDSGEHVLHCELLNITRDSDGGHEFRIISVISI